MARNVSRAIVMLCSSAVRAQWMSRKSSVIDGGNFGAAPNPPRRASKEATSSLTARLKVSRVNPPARGERSTDDPYISRTDSVVRAIASLLPRYASATEIRIRRKDGMPCRSSFGQ